MQISIDDINGVTVLRLNGNIDISSSPDVKKSLDKEVISPKKEKVLIDLEAVNYVDSSGLATLVEILKNMRAYGGKLKLSSLSAKVLGLFEITKLDKLFDISDNAEEALNTF